MKNKHFLLNYTRTSGFNSFMRRVHARVHTGKVAFSHEFTIRRIEKSSLIRRHPVETPEAAAFESADDVRCAS